MAKGRWIYEWLVDRVWPHADLFALLLDRWLQPRELVRDERFRRAIGSNDHDGATWFNGERFANAVNVLGLPRPAELRRTAEQAGYRLDALETALAATPKWASTRKPSRPALQAPLKTAARPTESPARKTPRK